MSDPFNPFSTSSDLKLTEAGQKDRTNRSVVLGELVKYTLIDNHDLLVQARKAVLDAGDPPELMAMFDAVPFNNKELPAFVAEYASKDEVRIKKVRDTWLAKSRAQFTDIIAKAKTYKSGR